MVASVVNIKSNSKDSKSDDIYSGIHFKSEGEDVLENGTLKQCKEYSIKMRNMLQTANTDYTIWLDQFNKLTKLDDDIVTYKPAKKVTKGNASNSGAGRPISDVTKAIIELCSKHTKQNPINRKDINSFVQANFKNANIAKHGNFLNRIFWLKSKQLIATDGSGNYWGI